MCAKRKVKKYERCPMDCEYTRNMFPTGSKQRKGIFHDSVGKCYMCGKEIKKVI